MTAAWAAAGVDSNRAQHLALVVQDYRDGFYSGFNDLVETISGSRPTTVEQYVKGNRTAFDTDGPLAITDARLSGGVERLDPARAVIRIH